MTNHSQNNDPQLDALLKQMAADHRPQLPSPSLIWWRAQILRKQQEQERIERPVRIMRLVALVVCCVVPAALAIANREQFQALMGGSSWLLLPLGLVLLAALLISASVLRSSAKGR